MYTSINTCIIKVKNGSTAPASQTTRRAFTLIEILASLLLFALGVTAIIAVIAQGLKTAVHAQSEATAWATAMTVLKDPLPMGGEVDPASGLLRRWTWAKNGSTWIANEVGSTDPVWSYTTWSTNQTSDVLVPDMGSPLASNLQVFPSGSVPRPGCAHGWMNGYYIERREQSRASDQIAQGVRLIEVRVDVYWARSFGSEAKSLASVVDRYIRQEAP